MSFLATLDGENGHKSRVKVGRRESDYEMRHRWTTDTDESREKLDVRIVSFRIACSHIFALEKKRKIK